MTADQYVESVLEKYAVARGPNSPAAQLLSAVAAPLRSWASDDLNDLQYSGSYAKGTAVRGIADVDIFISLKSGTAQNLRDLYQSLFLFAQKQGWSPRQQNVSIGITLGGVRADLVPGKVQAGYQDYHSLYRRKADTWTQTNVSLHINTVRDSDRVREIKALKIWRFLRKIDFPSLYLELFTIAALSGRSRQSPAEKILYALETIATSLTSTRVEDPANSNNVLSDELSQADKKQIASMARESLQEQSWEKIIW